MKKTRNSKSSTISQLKALMDENFGLKDILYQIPGCIYWKNAEGVYLGCNKTFSDMVGANSPEDVVGKTDFDLSWRKYADYFRKNDVDAMENGPISFEEDAKLADGKEFTYTVIKSPLHDEDGKVVGVIGVSVDISKRKQLEEALRIEKENAEAANRAKSDFIANMSHDLKTPLSGIIGLSEGLTYTLKDKQHVELVQYILTASQQLMQFVDNCLEMSKLEVRNISLIREKFNLQGLFDEIHKLFQPACNNKGLFFNLFYDEKAPAFFIGSRAGIYRIILNLVGNAIKFTKTGGVSISVNLKKKQSHNEQQSICIMVEDTGIGIPKDQQKNIFEKFTQLTPSYTGLYEGSGIGLYIVEKFLQAMEGSIKVESEENKGSRFIITLPLKSAVENVSTKKAANTLETPEVELGAFTTNLTQGALRILLVEDNVTAQKVGSIFLTPFSTVEVAGCGKDVLEMFQPGKYDLVFMDIGLPDFPGYTVTEHIRQKEAGTRHCVPIVGLTAHATTNDELLSKQAGMHGMLNKPLSLEKAKQVIAYYIYNQKIKVKDLKLLNAKLKTSQEVFKNKTKLIKNSTQKTLESPFPLTDKAIPEELLEILIASLKEAREEMTTAFQKNDIQQLTAAVHKLHGGLCYTNTPLLREHAKHLEIAAKNGNIRKIPALLQTLLDAMDLLEKTFAA